MIWFAIGAIIGGVQFATLTVKKASILQQPLPWLVAAFLTSSLAGAIVYGMALWFLAKLLLLSLGFSSEFDLWRAH